VSAANFGVEVFGPSDSSTELVQLVFMRDSYRSSSTSVPNHLFFVIAIKELYILYSELLQSFSRMSRRNCGL
jgi:hypothetical protein